MVPMELEIKVTAIDGGYEVEYVHPGVWRTYLQTPKGSLEEALAGIAREYEQRDGN
jgi:hypothetical protein